MKRKKILIREVVIVIFVLVISIITVVVIFQHSDFYTNKTGKLADINKIETKVKTLMDAGNFDEAKKNVLVGIVKYPDDYKLKLALANIYLEEGSVKSREKEDSAKAQKILFSLEDKGYKSVNLYDLIGYSYEILNQYSKAFKYYDKSLAINPNSVNTLFQKGHTYWLQGNFSKTSTYYYKAEKSITNKTSREVKSKLYVAIGTLQGGYFKDQNKAEEYFNKALAVTDSRALKAEFYYDLSTLEILARKNVQKSLMYANKAISIDPTNELGHVAFVRAKIGEGNINEKNLKDIEDHLSRAILLNTQKSLTRYWSGQLFYYIKNFRMALSEFKETIVLIDRDNSIPDAYKKLSKADAYFGMAVSDYQL